MSEEWKCHYCNELFDSMFDRDRIHHPTHLEHWKRLYYASLKTNEQALREQTKRHRKKVELFSEEIIKIIDNYKVGVIRKDVNYLIATLWEEMGVLK